MQQTDSEPAFRQYLAEQLSKRSVEVSDRWLARLEDIVDEETRDIFPTETYLDHIPSLIEEVALVLQRSDEELALANSLINRKATQLGQLRHQQKATVNQLLREYDILSKILEEFITEEATNYPGSWCQADGILLMASVSRVVRSILQATVDSFVENYMHTIKEQTEKLMAFNTFVSHELKTPLQGASLNMEMLLENKDPTDEHVMDLVRVQSSIHLCYVFSERGSWNRLNVAMVGPAGNIARSWVEASTVLPIEVVQVAPPHLGLSKEDLGPRSSTTNDLRVLERADIIVTDCWPNNTSSDEQEVLASLRIDGKTLDRSRSDVMFIPCPPVTRGEEVSVDAMKHSRCLATPAKAFLMHVQNSFVENATGRNQRL